MPVRLINVFGDGYPITSLKRDDLRTVRWLTLFAAGMRAADRSLRVHIYQATKHDPGPKVLDLIAAHTDSIRAAYESGEYGEANRLQKHLANWVTRIGVDPDWTGPSETRSQGEMIMTFWKQAWNVAKDIQQTRELLDSGTRVIAESDALLAGKNSV